ncbi:MAG: SBBP repeat-containing protein [Candidatus Sifarchaeia archaeon]
MKSGKCILAFILVAILAFGSASYSNSSFMNETRQHYLSQFDLADSMLYSTYFGGDTRQSDDDRGAEICIGPGGDIYCLVWTTTRYWSTVNSYHDTFQGGQSDMVLLIMNSDGTEYRYCSFLGGDGMDFGVQMEVDSDGAVYIAGTTNSSNLASAGAYCETINGSNDVFVMKFKPSIDGQENELIYSTYVGGSHNDEANSIVIDSEGNAYVTGFTFSDNFPHTNGIDTTLNGSFDAFVCKLNPDGTQLVFSTYLGGKNGDSGVDITLGVNDEVLVTGQTWSPDFYCSEFAYDTTLNGSDDAFFTKLTSDGSAILASTFIGGIGSEYGSCSVVDEFGDIYVTGWTQSQDFITVDAYDSSYNGEQDIFLRKYSPNCDEVLYSTFLGGLENEMPRGLAVDVWNNIYICGGTDSGNFPLVNAFDEEINGESQPLVYRDCFVLRLEPEANRLLFSSYLGGGSNEDASKLELDEHGNLVFCGMTNSFDFPCTSNAHQQEFYPGEWDAFLVVLYDKGDMDGDLLPEYKEAMIGTSRSNNDTDSDLIPDGYEFLNGLDPLTNDSFQDIDNDGLSNLEEYLQGTDPNNRDSDSDTIPDGWEVANGYSPTDANVPLSEIIVYNAPLFAIGAVIIVSVPIVYFLRPKPKRNEIRVEDYDREATHLALRELSGDVMETETEASKQDNDFVEGDE